MKPDLSFVDPLHHHLATRVNVGDDLVRTAALFPDRVAIVDGDKEVTFRTLVETADRLGHGLRSLGLETGEPVAVMVTNSWEFLATYFACARAGLVFLPLNYLLTTADLVWILKDAGCHALVSDAAVLPRAREIASLGAGITHLVALGAPAPEIDGVTSTTWEGLVENAPSEPLEVIVPERDAVQCLYTSGTTSKPKGVLTSHVAVSIALLSNALATDQPWGEKSNVMAIALPLFHVTALNTLAMPPLRMGGTVVLAGKSFTADGMLDAIEKHHVTHFAMLPMMFAACLAEQKKRARDLSSVRRAIYAMAPMPAHILAASDDLFPNADVLLGSGQTEVVPATTMQWPEHRHSAADSWGPQAPTVFATTITAGQVNARNETGEIVYRSPNVCLGYWNNAAANEAAFADGYFHSGDVGHLDDDGVVWFTDRLKDIIKTGGENVSSLNVERTLMSLGGVAECAVIGVPHARWGEAVCAVVVPDGSVAEEELPDRVVAYAREHLAPFEVPKLVKVTGDLPKTATGKLQKALVREMVQQD